MHSTAPHFIPPGSNNLPVATPTLSREPSDNDSGRSEDFSSATEFPHTATSEAFSVYSASNDFSSKSSVNEDRIAIENMCNKRHERLQKPCQNGFCYCFTSDSDDLRQARRVATKPKHKTMRHKDHTHYESLPLVKCPQYSHQAAKPEIHGQRHKLLAPVDHRYTKKKGNVKIQVLTCDKDAAHKNCHLTQTRAEDTTSCDSDSPMIHIIQKIQKDRVISEVRVERKKKKDKMKGAHLHKSGSATSFVTARSKLDNIDENRDTHNRNHNTSIDAVSSDSLVEKPKFDGYKGGALLLKRTGTTSAGVYNNRVGMPPKKPPRSFTSGSEQSFISADHSKKRSDKKSKGSAPRLGSVYPNLDKELEREMHGAQYPESYNTNGKHNLNEVINKNGTNQPNIQDKESPYHFYDEPEKNIYSPSPKSSHPLPDRQPFTPTCPPMSENEISRISNAAYQPELWPDLSEETKKQGMKDPASKHETVKPHALWPDLSDQKETENVKSKPTIVITDSEKILKSIHPSKSIWPDLPQEDGGLGLTDGAKISHLPPQNLGGKSSMPGLVQRSDHGHIYPQIGDIPMRSSSSGSGSNKSDHHHPGGGKSSAKDFVQFHDHGNVYPHTAIIQTKSSGTSDERNDHTNVGNVGGRSSGQGFVQHPDPGSVHPNALNIPVQPGSSAHVINKPHDHQSGGNMGGTSSAQGFVQHPDPKSFHPNAGNIPVQPGSSVHGIIKPHDHQSGGNVGGRSSAQGFVQHPDPGSAHTNTGNIPLQPGSSAHGIIKPHDHQSGGNMGGTSSAQGFVQHPDRGNAHTNTGNIPLQPGSSAHGIIKPHDHQSGGDMGGTGSAQGFVQHPDPKSFHPNAGNIPVQPGSSAHGIIKPHDHQSGGNMGGTSSAQGFVQHPDPKSIHPNALNIPVQAGSSGNKPHDHQSGGNVGGRSSAQGFVQHPDRGSAHTNTGNIPLQPGSSAHGINKPHDHQSGGNVGGKSSAQGFVQHPDPKSIHPNAGNIPVQPGSSGNKPHDHQSGGNMGGTGSAQGFVQHPDPKSFHPNAGNIPVQPGSSAHGINKPHDHQSGGNVGGKSSAQGFVQHPDPKSIHPNAGNIPVQPGSSAHGINKPHDHQSGGNVGGTSSTQGFVQHPDPKSIHPNAGNIPVQPGSSAHGINKPHDHQSGGNVGGTGSAQGFVQHPDPKSIHPNAGNIPVQPGSSAHGINKPHDHQSGGNVGGTSSTQGFVQHPDPKSIHPNAGNIPVQPGSSAHGINKPHDHQSGGNVGGTGSAQGFVQHPDPKSVHPNALNIPVQAGSSAHGTNKLHEQSNLAHLTGKDPALVSSQQSEPGTSSFMTARSSTPIQDEDITHFTPIHTQTKDKNEYWTPAIPYSSNEHGDKHVSSSNIVAIPSAPPQDLYPPLNSQHSGSPLVTPNIIDRPTFPQDPLRWPDLNKEINTRSVSPQIGWVPQHDALEIVNMLTRNNRQDPIHFGTSNTSAGPQIGWVSPHKLEIDTVDSIPVARENDDFLNFASNMESKSTPIKRDLSDKNTVKDFLLKESSLDDSGKKRKSPSPSRSQKSKSKDPEKLGLRKKALKGTKTFFESSKTKFFNLKKKKDPNPPERDFDMELDEIRTNRILTPVQEITGPSNDSDITVRGRRLDFTTDQNNDLTFDVGNGGNGNGNGGHGNGNGGHGHGNGRNSEGGAIVHSMKTPPKPPRQSRDKFDFNRTVDSPKHDKTASQRKLMFSPRQILKNLGHPNDPPGQTPQSYKSYASELNDDVTLTMNDLLGNIREKLESSPEGADAATSVSEKNSPKLNSPSSPEAAGARGPLAAGRSTISDEPIYAEITELNNSKTDTVRQPQTPTQITNFIAHEVAHSNPLAVYAKIQKKTSNLNKSQSLNNLSAHGSPMGRRRSLNKSILSSESDIFLENLFAPKKVINSGKKQPPSPSKKKGRPPPPPIPHPWVPPLGSPSQGPPPPPPPPPGRRTPGQSSNLQRKSGDAMTGMDSPIISVNDNDRKSPGSSHDQPPLTGSNKKDDKNNRDSFPNIKIDIKNMSVGKSKSENDKDCDQRHNPHRTKSINLELMKNLTDSDTVDFHFQSCSDTQNVDKTTVQTQCPTDTSCDTSFKSAKNTPTPTPTPTTRSTTSTMQTYKSLRDKLRTSFRKSKNYLKNETRRLSNALNRSGDEEGAVGYSTPRNFDGNEIYPQGIFDEISSKDCVKSQIAQAVSICRQMPEFESSTQLVEAERLLLYTTLKEDAAKKNLVKMDYTQEGLAPSFLGQDGRLVIHEFQIPVKSDTNYDRFFNFFYIGVFANGSEIKSTYSEEKGHDIVYFRNCNIFFDNLDSNFEINVDIYALRLKKMTNLNKTKEKAALKKRSSSSSLDSHEEVISRFKLHGYFTLKGLHLTPYTIKDVHEDFVLKEQFSLESQAGCVLPINLVSRNTNLLNEVRLTASVEMNFNNFALRGFLNVKDMNGNHWNKKWCQIDAVTLYFWNYPQDCFEKQPLQRIDLAECVSLPIGAADRSICAKPRAFSIEVCSSKDCSDVEIHLFSTDSQTEYDYWVNYLNEVVKFARNWKL